MVERCSANVNEEEAQKKTQKDLQKLISHQIYSKSNKISSCLERRAIVGFVLLLLLKFRKKKDRNTFFSFHSTRHRNYYLSSIRKMNRK